MKTPRNMLGGYAAPMTASRRCAGERLRSRSHEEHGIRDRRQGGRPRHGRGVRRPGRGWACRARARGRGRESASRRSGSRASRSRARVGSASSRRDRRRPSAASLTQGWATCSRMLSRRRAGALDAEATRARGRAAPRGGHGRRGRSRARSAWRCATRWSCSASARRSCSRSTTSSGSTRPRRARLRSRCDGSPRARCSCCSPGGSSLTPSRPGWSRRWTRGASSGCRWDRSASARCTGSCATGSGRPFARQTLLRIHERSGGNPFFALELARVLDCGRRPARAASGSETLEELVRARLAGLPAATREALALASALGTPSESLLERAGIAADALAPAFAAHVIERERRQDPLHPPAAVVGALPRPRRAAAERARADRGDRRGPAAARASPRALEGRA